MAQEVVAPRASQRMPTVRRHVLEGQRRHGLRLGRVSALRLRPRLRHLHRSRGPAMITWLKKSWRLWRHKICPRCRGAGWRAQEGLCLGRRECTSCGFVVGFDSYEDAVVRDFVEHGYSGMPS